MQSMVYSLISYPMQCVQLFRGGFHGNFHNVPVRRALIGMTSLEFSKENWCVTLLWDRLDLGKFARKFHKIPWKKIFFEKSCWKFPWKTTKRMWDKTITLTFGQGAQENSTPSGAVHPWAK